MSEFVEIKNWGFNTLIITSLLTLICTLIQGFGIVKQAGHIWREKSVKSISAPLFFLYFFFFFAFIFYGLEKHSLTMTISGLLAVLYFPIIIGLIKFKKLNLFEIISLILSASIVPVMIMVKDKDLFLLFLSFLSLLVLGTQPWKMLKEKSRGVVDITYVIIFMLSSLFWLGYAIAASNWVLQAFNSGSLLIYIFIIYLYRKYKN